MNSKVGRNEPCRCGSGRKYKRCHCDIDHHGLSAKQTITYDFESSAPTVGLPGSHGEFAIEISPARGPFSVVATLRRPDAWPSTLETVTNAERLRGDSHIKFPDTAGDKLELPGDFEGSPIEAAAIANDKHYLAQLMIRGIEATGFKEARERALAPLTYILNCLAFEHDVPVEIYQIDVVDEPSGQKCITARLPFAFGYLDSLTMPLAMRQHAALYREALNTPNELYAFLCFFKLIELLREERLRDDADVVESGGKPRHTPIIPPSDREALVDWLRAIFPSWYNWTTSSVSSAIHGEAQGVKFDKVYEKTLRPLRDRIAHGLLDREGVINIDDPELRRQAKLWASYCRTIARKMLLERFYDPSAFSGNNH